MEFLDFQIWTGPWIWKYGWKCGMVKDLALWEREKSEKSGLFLESCFTLGSWRNGGMGTEKGWGGDGVMGDRVCEDEWMNERHLNGID